MILIEQRIKETLTLKGLPVNNPVRSAGINHALKNNHEVVSCEEQHEIVMIKAFAIVMTGNPIRGYFPVHCGSTGFTGGFTGNPFRVFSLFHFNL